MNSPKNRSDISDNFIGLGFQAGKSKQIFVLKLAEALGSRELKWLSRETGISSSTLSDYFRGTIPRADKAVQIARALDTTVEALFGSEPARPRSTSPVHFEDAGELVDIPVIDIEASAGDGTEFSDAVVGEYVGLPRIWLHRQFGGIAGLKLVRVKGDSMEPDLRDGDWALIDENQCDLRDGIHVVRLDDHLMIKRVQVQGRVVRLVSSNPVYGPIDVDLAREGDRFKIIGRCRWAGKMM